jgi:hypothetical protein
MKESFHEDLNNLSIADSDDSGIQVFQNSNKGLNCCSG